MISAPGVGSGLDIESIVTQLMEVERLPVQKLEARRAEVDVEISAHGQLKGAIAALESAAKGLGDASSLGKLSASSAFEGIFSASANADAPQGTHSINVLSLASNHRVASNPIADSSSTTLGTGTLTVGVGADSFDVVVDASNNTLAGVRDAINAAADNKGVSASIVQADDGARLILTAGETGTANAVSISGLASLSFSEITAAADAQVQVDGFTVTSGSNTLTDVISGVTLTLEGVGADTLTVGTDSESIVESMQAFVDAYESLRTTMADLKAGPLQGESIIRSLESKLRDDFAREVPGLQGQLSYGFQVGLSFDKNGALSLDTAELKAAVESNLSDVVALFTTEEHGLGTRLQTTLDAYVGSGGLIDARTEGLQSRGRTIDGRIANGEFRLEKVEERYYNQFAGLDALLANLQVTGTYLNQQLASLPANNVRR